MGDAHVIVEVEPDKMAAYLTVSPGNGALTGAQIRQALAESRVVFGILYEAVDQAAAVGTANRLLIAKGCEAVDGEDGWFKSLIELARERRPRLDEQDNIDYRDFGGIATVREGDRLMQKMPPSQGDEGTNVLGEVIPAKPGKQVAFAAHIKGAEVDPGNPAFLIAKISGQPVLSSHCMMVEPTVNLKAVDLATGNVDFEGSINITGDVRAGMVIRASGDIHVGGMVEGAALEAGGNVVVKGGIIGQGSLYARSGGADSTARVRAGASCTAYFIENAHVSAGDSIIVERLVRQSELAAVNRIVVGKRGSEQGTIIGGQVAATLSVQAKTIGSQAGIKTLVRVGTNPYMQEKLAFAASQKQAKAKKLEEVIKLLGFIENNQMRVRPETRIKAESTRLMLIQENEQAQQEMDTLNLALDLSRDARVLVEKNVFENVHVEICNKVHVTEVMRSSGKFSLMEGKVVFA